MPRKTDITPINNKFLDRRTRLLDCQKEMVKYWYDRGISIRAISRMFKVDKRTIQFLLFPERLKKNIQDRKERGGWKQYYNKTEHAQAIKEHRNYKKAIL